MMAKTFREIERRLDRVVLLRSVVEASLLDRAGRAWRRIAVLDMREEHARAERYWGPLDRAERALDDIRRVPCPANTNAGGR